MNSQLTDVSVVIRTKNEEQYIEKTLERVKEQRFRRKYELIVVDSGSTDATLSLVRRHAVRLVEIPENEFSYGRSLNIGCEEARGRYIVNLSAHAVPQDGYWLAALVDGFVDGNVAGVYGKQISLPSLNPFEARKNELFFGRHKKMFKMPRGKFDETPNFSNGNCSIKKEVWKRFKFDEKAPYAEDILWQDEVLSAGYSILYEPAAAVWHTHEVNIYRAYQNARCCAFTLAGMRSKRQFLPLAAYDLALAVGEGACSLWQDLAYIWKGGYRDFVKLAPLYVTASALGWFVGRVQYRAGKP